jgi:hypothetical protein
MLKLLVILLRKRCMGWNLIRQMTFRSTAIVDALSGSLPSLCSYIIAMTFQLHSILEHPMKIHHCSINHKIYLFLLDIYEIIVCIIIMGWKNIPHFAPGSYSPERMLTFLAYSTIQERVRYGYVFSVILIG